MFDSFVVASSLSFGLEKRWSNDRCGNNLDWEVVAILMPLYLRVIVGRVAIGIVCSTVVVVTPYPCAKSTPGVHG